MLRLSCELDHFRKWGGELGVVSRETGVRQAVLGSRGDLVPTVPSKDKVTLNAH